MTRAELESEREALALLLKHTTYQVNAGHEWLIVRRDALTASIARIDALLSLSDEAAKGAYGEISQRAASTGWAATQAEDPERYARLNAVAQALRTIADLVRRS